MDFVHNFQKWINLGNLLTSGVILLKVHWKEGNSKVTGKRYFVLFCTESQDFSNYTIC